MKVLGAAALLLEAITILLAIPVLLTLYDAGRAVVIVFALAAAMAVFASGLMRRRPSVAVAVGWLVQGMVFATAFALPAMLIVAAMFSALWWASLHLGARADAAKAARQPDPLAG